MLRSGKVKALDPNAFASIFEAGAASIQAFQCSGEAADSKGFEAWKHSDSLSDACYQDDCSFVHCVV
jgi:hypothetical protein